MLGTILNKYIHVNYNIQCSIIIYIQRMKQSSTAPKLSTISTEPTKLESIDGPPLDFSFKNIRSLNELLQNMTNYAQNMEKKQFSESLSNANNGSTLKATTFNAINKNASTNNMSAANNGANNSISNINNNNANQGQKQVAEKEMTQTKLQIIRTTETLDRNYVQNKNKKIVNKKEKVQKKVKKVISPLTTSIFLRYNKLASIDNFNMYIEPIFPNFLNNLMWIDLSHNKLMQLSPDLGQLKNLKTLYLHANYISSFDQLTKVKKATLLRTLTIHANPLETYEQFRIVIHSILTSLKKIDSTLLTKRQTQRAQVLMKSMKKYPTIKNPKLPPQQSDNEDQDD